MMPSSTLEESGMNMLVQSLFKDSIIVLFIEIGVSVLSSVGIVTRLLDSDGKKF